jgi:hypothetical protein
MYNTLTIKVYGMFESKKKPSVKQQQVSTEDEER